MPESLGEKLQQARQDRGISISEVAEQTRIAAHYLEAIEQDDYRTLPGGIFNKGFVKSFAKYVGIDEQDALQDYARISSSQIVERGENDSLSYRPEVLTDDSSGPSMLPTVIFAVLILGLMTWGIFALVNYLQNSESQKVENNIANNNVKIGENSKNANTNTGTAVDQSIPATDKISVKISAPELAISATVDGKREVRTLNSEVTEQVIEAEETLVLSYFKGLADTVQLTLNGKKIETPLPPPGYKRNAFVYEINMNNIKRILKTGKISSGEAENSNTKTPVSSNSTRNANTAANRNSATQNPAAVNTTVPQQ
ncbi:MAG: helix-turn-helix domain-containing protein [Pyrinomonadaceae bacterium]|nr:helix-turn-helix domain-containing protein [Pyrinomonadaceae bacterium]